MDIEKAITEGIVFKGGKSPSGKQEDKVKTKAKKKSYITGLHGSGAAKMKAEFRKKRPRNKRGKTAKKVKDVKKIAISFTIVKNITAKTGERTLYIRIAKPDNDILTKNASNTFPYENRNLVYSIKKYIEYTGEEQNVTVYWDVEEYLPAGTYHVYIFADGTMIGQQAFSMK